MIPRITGTGGQHPADGALGFALALDPQTDSQVTRRLLRCMFTPVSNACMVVLLPLWCVNGFRSDRLATRSRSRAAEFSANALLKIAQDAAINGSQDE